MAEGSCWCGNYQSGSRWSVCGRSQERSAKGATGCRPVASLVEPFRGSENLVCSQTSATESPGQEATRDAFDRGGEATPSLVSRVYQQQAKKKRCSPPGARRALPQGPRTSCSGSRDHTDCSSDGSL